MSKQKTPRNMIAALALLISGAIGCRGAELAEAPESALRQRFPDHAARVLDAGDGFVAAGEGIEGWQHALVTLPRAAEGTIVLRGFGDAAVGVRELGVEGEGEPLERAVVYRRAGRTSFWTAGPGRIEEWLHFEAGASDLTVTWEVAGALARQHGEGVELVDAGGVVRLSVTAPAAYAAGGRAIGARLIARGTRIELQVDAGDEAVLVDPLWVPAGAMSQARGWFTTTLLNKGDVLAAGGYDGNSTFAASAERYDPSGNSWMPASPMTEGRGYHTATRLKNGTVLVAGGCCNPGDLATAEVYDPAIDTWSPAGSMGHVRRNHVAMLLGNGKVLVAGGFDDVTSLATAELYDPTSNSWSPAGAMAAPRDFFTATLLGNGKVLVVGGFQDGFTSPLKSAEIYDPTSGTWSPAGAMFGARANHTATLLANGKVLVAGGGDDVSSSLASAELYNPVTNTWSLAGPMSQARVGHTATRLVDGHVLAAGGSTGGFNSVPLASAELYDPVADAWSPTSTMIEARGQHTATTLLGSAKVLVAGGYTTGGPGVFPALASAELYVFPAPLGNPCTVALDCESGFCANGVCCNTACGGGPCDACSLAAGAAVDGTCALLDGKPCDDGDVCTQSDACQAGLCAGAPVTCPALDTCHVAGQCDASTGACASPAKPDNAACDDGDACTQSDTCHQGVCKGDKPVLCEAEDACHDSGACDAKSGTCSTPARPDGTPCPGGMCSSGACIPTTSGSGGASSTSTGASSGGVDASQGGCGCGVSGSPATGGLWLALGLLLLLRRRPR